MSKCKDHLREIHVGPGMAALVCAVCNRQLNYNEQQCIGPPAPAVNVEGSDGGELPIARRPLIPLVEPTTEGINMPEVVAAPAFDQRELAEDFLDVWEPPAGKAN